MFSQHSDLVMACLFRNGNLQAGFGLNFCFLMGPFSKSVYSDNSNNNNNNNCISRALFHVKHAQLCLASTNS